MFTICLFVCWFLCSFLHIPCIYDNQKLYFLVEVTMKNHFHSIVSIPFWKHGFSLFYSIDSLFFFHSLSLCTFRLLLLSMLLSLSLLLLLPLLFHSVLFSSQFNRNQEHLSRFKRFHWNNGILNCLCSFGIRLPPPPPLPLFYICVMKT